MTLLSSDDDFCIESCHFSECYPLAMPRVAQGLRAWMRRAGTRLHYKLFLVTHIQKRDWEHPLYHRALIYALSADDARARVETHHVFQTEEFEATEVEVKELDPLGPHSGPLVISNV